MDDMLNLVALTLWTLSPGSYLFCHAKYVNENPNFCTLTAKRKKKKRERSTSIPSAILYKQKT